jgi:hypothetical protein
MFPLYNGQPISALHGDTIGEHCGRIALTKCNVRCYLKLSR